ncbi:MAG: GYD domain-containing protein [Acidimicrobiales bacterium]
MSKFVILINVSYDEEAQVKNLPDQLAQGHEIGRSLGVTIDSYYMTFGRFDAVATIDAPDGAAAAKFILSAFGPLVRTETLTAFNEDQIRAIADGLLS